LVLKVSESSGKKVNVYQVYVRFQNSFGAGPSFDRTAGNYFQNLSDDIIEAKVVRPIQRVQQVGA
jgi:hypothetical protein